MWCNCSKDDLLVQAAVLCVMMESAAVNNWPRSAHHHCRWKCEVWHHHFWLLGFSPCMAKDDTAYLTLRITGGDKSQIKNRCPEGRFCWGWALDLLFCIVTLAEVRSRLKEIQPPENSTWVRFPCDWDLRSNMCCCFFQSEVQFFFFFHNKKCWRLCLGCSFPVMRSLIKWVVFWESFCPFLSPPCRKSHYFQLTTGTKKLFTFFCHRHIVFLFLVGFNMLRTVSQCPWGQRLQDFTA